MAQEAHECGTKAQANNAEAVQRFAMPGCQKYLTDAGISATSGLGNGDLFEEDFQLQQQNHSSGMLGRRIQDLLFKCVPI